MELSEDDEVVQEKNDVEKCSLSTMLSICMMPM